MRKRRFEDTSPEWRMIKDVIYLKFSGVYEKGRGRIFALDSLFWQVSAVLSDLDAALEKRLPSA